MSTREKAAIVIPTYRCYKQNLADCIVSKLNKARKNQIKLLLPKVTTNVTHT